jgi:heat shock protein HslJ
VQSPIKFVMAVNLRTAKSLGLDVPPTLLATADEVIDERTHRAVMRLAARLAATGAVRLTSLAVLLLLQLIGHAIADSPLRGTYWRLVRLHETPVQAPDKQREPHLIFANHELRISGSGGCNRLTGSFEIEGDELKLGRIATTRMACPEGMEQEHRFFQSLDQVERYRISGSHLEMLDAQDALVARFEAVALR